MKIKEKIIFFDLIVCFLSKALFILFATIVGSFCAEPTSVEANTQQTIKDEAQPQKRHIGLGALSDCDGPSGVVAGLHAGIHSDVAVHSDLSLGLHGHGYAPAYGSGYLGSGALLSPVGAIGHIGGVGHIGTVGHVGSLGAFVAAPQVVSGGYAPHAPVLASSIVSHAPVVSPTVRYFLLRPFN